MQSRTLAYVNRELPGVHHQPREVIVSTVAGTIRVRRTAERVHRAPNGEPILIVSHGDAANLQIEHGDHLHAVVRPSTLRLTTEVHHE